MVITMFYDYKYGWYIGRLLPVDCMLTILMSLVMPASKMALEEDPRKGKSEAHRLAIPCKSINRDLGKAERKKNNHE